MLGWRRRGMAPIVVVALMLGGCGSAETPDDSAAALTTSTTAAGRESDAVTGKNHREAELKGSAEIPGPGDADGTGAAFISEQPTGTAETFCYQVEVQKIAAPTAAHIHKGENAVAGPPVVTFGAFGEDDKGGYVSSACLAVDAALAADIFENPESYYVNVHNAEFPDGALRGQLAVGERCTPASANFGMGEGTVGFAVIRPPPLLYAQRCGTGRATA